MDALAQDASQVLLALHDGHARSGLMRGQRGSHAGGASSDDDHVEGLRLHGRCSSDLCGSGLRASAAHDLVLILSGVSFAIAAFFMWRSFYQMRIDAPMLTAADLAQEPAHQ